MLSYKCTGFLFCKWRLQKTIYVKIIYPKSEKNDNIQQYLDNDDKIYHTNSTTACSSTPATITKTCAISIARTIIHAISTARKVMAAERRWCRQPLSAFLSLIHSRCLFIKRNVISIVTYFIYLVLVNSSPHALTNNKNKQTNTLQYSFLPRRNLPLSSLHVSSSSSSYARWICITTQEL